MKTPQLPKIIKNTLNIPLITKYKQQLKKKEIKNIRKNLLNLAKIDLAESNQLKIKVLKDEQEEERKKEFVIIAPVCFKHYFEDFKKLKAILPRKKEEDEITPSSNAETVKQIESSDISADEEEKIL